MEKTCESCGQRIRKPKNNFDREQSEDPLKLYKKGNNVLKKLSCSQPHMPIYVQVIHQGFWVTNSDGMHSSTTNRSVSRNSVMLSPRSLLYVYKLALRHLLLTLKVIVPEDIDPANLVPHIVVRKNPKDPFSKYDSIQNKTYTLEQSHLSAKTNFLILELDSRKDLHMTLIYSKKIHKRIDLKQAFLFVLQVLNKFPSLIVKYQALPYFGEREITYWYHVSKDYPFNIECPADYEPINSNAFLEEPKTKPKVLPSGSIIGYE